MSQFEKSSQRMVSVLRRQMSNEIGKVVHRSDEGVIHRSHKENGDSRRTRQHVKYFSSGGAQPSRMDARIIDCGEIEDLGKVYQSIKDVFKPIQRSDGTSQDSDLDNRQLNQGSQVLGNTQIMNTDFIRQTYFKRQGRKKQKKPPAITQINIRENSAVNSQVLNFVRQKNRISYECSSYHTFRDDINRSYQDKTFAKAGNSVVRRNSVSHQACSPKNSKRQSPQTANTSMIFQRDNIISLETGLPAKPYLRLAQFEKKIQMRDHLFDPNRKKQNIQGIGRRDKQISYPIQGANGLSRLFTPGGQSIVTSLNEYFSIKESQQSKKVRNQSLIQNADNPNTIRPTLQQKYNNLKNKVELNEISIIKNCEDFLHCKKNMDIEFLNMIGTASRDRPITQDIRLRLYTASNSKRRNLNELRRSAEKERKSMINNNSKQHKWYENLINEITKIRNDNEKLDLCQFVFDKIRNLLEDGFELKQDSFFGILGDLEKQGKQLEMNNVGMYLIKRIIDDLDIGIERLNQYQFIKKYLQDLGSEKIL